MKVTRINQIFTYSITALLMIGFVSITHKSMSQTKNFSMVPGEILQAVFQISPDKGASSGSCIAISVDGANYIVTAKHVLNPILSKKDVTFYLSHNGKWDEFKGKLFLHDNSSIDIAVILLEQKDLVSDFDIGSKGYFASQECFFLGYPYGLKTEDVSGVFNKGFPVPFIKKGIISSFTFENKDNPIAKIFVDATNNLGFSGGPLVIQNFDAGSKFNMRVIGIVSNYIVEYRSVTLKSGEVVTVPENTGIMQAVPMDYAVAIIKKITAK